MGSSHIAFVIAILCIVGVSLLKLLCPHRENHPRNEEAQRGEGVLMNVLSINVYAYFSLLYMLIVNISKIVEI